MINSGLILLCYIPDPPLHVIDGDEVTTLVPIQIAKTNVVSHPNRSQFGLRLTV